jgi:hypothetical protein
MDPALMLAEFLVADESEGEELSSFIQSLVEQFGMTEIATSFGVAIATLVRFDPINVELIRGSMTWSDEDFVDVPRVVTRFHQNVAATLATATLDASSMEPMDALTEVGLPTVTDAMESGGGILVPMLSEMCAWFLAAAFHATVLKLELGNERFEAHLKAAQQRAADAANP